MDKKIQFLEAVHESQTYVALIIEKVNVLLAEDGDPITISREAMEIVKEMLVGQSEIVAMMTETLSSVEDTMDELIDTALEGMK